MTAVWIYLNGMFIHERNAVVSIHDRGFRYGDGVFDTILVAESRPVLCEAHLDRLRRGASVLGLSGLPTREQMIAAIRELIDRNGLPTALVRLTVTRGASEGWEHQPEAAPTVVIAERPNAGYPARLYTQGAAVVVVGITRASPSALDPTIKSLNALPQVLAKQEATARGADEAILLAENGSVAEGSVSNVFCVTEGRIKTPPVSDGIFPGITRAAVIDLARREGLLCDELSLSPDELHQAEEVFLTGTGMGVLPVTSVDGRNISRSPGPITYALRRLYQDFLRTSLLDGRSSPLAG